MENCLDREVSYFSNCMDVQHPRSIMLMDWLQSEEYKKEVDIIRETSDVDIRKALKKRLPVIFDDINITDNPEWCKFHIDCPVQGCNDGLFTGCKFDKRDE